MQDNNKYIIDGDDLIALRVAAKGLIREFEEHIYLNKGLDTGFNTYWKNRVIELKELLQKTDWNNVKSLNSHLIND